MIGKKILFLLTVFLLTIPNVKGKSFGENEIPSIDYIIEENRIIVNPNNGLVWEFYKFYDVIYNSNNQVIIEESQWTLNYEAKTNNWKTRGTAQNITLKEIEDYEIRVTRSYWDYSQTRFDIIYLFIGNNAPKIIINGTIQPDNYKLIWGNSGINTTTINNDNLNHKIKCDQYSFDYRDIYENLGDITDTIIIEQQNNHKAEIIFNLGYVEDELFLDPSFGYDDSSSNDGVTAVQLSIKGTKFNTTEAGSVTNIWLYVYYNSGNPQNTTVLIYDENNTLLAYAPPRDLQGAITTFEWVNFNLTNPVNVLANRTYLLSAYGEDYSRVRVVRKFLAGSPYAIYKDDIGSWFNPSDPFDDTLIQYDHNTMLIYANYSLIGPPVNIGNCSKLFGAGFNDSDPYIYLKWEYSGNVSNYEIEHSTDGINFTRIAYTPNKYYNHTGLTNGSYHYYRVRSTFFYNGVWYNSSFSNINLERVYFINPSVSGCIDLTPLDINWLTSLIWIGLIFIGYLSRTKTVLLFAGILGLVLGLLLLLESGMIGIIIICFNLYLLYEGTDKE